MSALPRLRAVKSYESNSFLDPLDEY